MKLYIDGELIDPNSIQYTFGYQEDEITSMTLTGDIAKAPWLNTPQGWTYVARIDNRDLDIALPELLWGFLELDSVQCNDSNLPGKLSTFTAHMSTQKALVERVQYKNVQGTLK